MNGFTIENQEELLSKLERIADALERVASAVTLEEYYNKDKKGLYNSPAFRITNKTKCYEESEPRPVQQRNGIHDF